MPSFQGIGFLSDASGATSRAFGISRDATFVVGGGETANGFEAFRWTAPSGIEGLGFAEGKENSEGLAANEDGSVITGDAEGFIGTAPRAVRWSQSTGWELLESSDEFDVVQARGISADGNTLVGAGQFIGTVLREAFLWTPTAGIQLLGLLDGAATTATGVSADGTVVSAFAALDSGCHGGAALDERQRAGGVAAARRNGLVQRPEHLRRR